ncbi:MAG: menaquinone-dependent protoporphyrinogen IX dehydrogenase [Chromatiales bacterium]|jgi:menaquinone-dependent protoporphyrinogen oxidase|nr:menaquinone-dependent protoporphyrinogen IX dehydrogenase [Chromatiales bacterium]MDH4031593.1 menaquinone-dependent protoporphyrinogen IX dehydrogenase [Chromatiales bacterium]
MPNTLLIYHGIYGHTRRICEVIQAEMIRLGVSTDISRLDNCEADDLERFDAIVIGAAIRNGKHNSAVLEFIRTRRDLLESKPSGFFSVNLVARKPEKNTPETNPYVKAFLARSPWQPKLVGVFAGNLDYQRYRFMDRHIIRFIMTLTGGPTDLHTKIEFTDWDRVREFAGQVTALTADAAGS